MCENNKKCGPCSLKEAEAKKIVVGDTVYKKENKYIAKVLKIKGDKAYIEMGFNKSKEWVKLSDLQTKSFFSEKKLVKEGTWALNKEYIPKLKSAIEGIIKTTPKHDFTKENAFINLISKLESLFFNKIGDDYLWDLVSNAKESYLKDFPDWKQNFQAAIDRLNKLSLVESKQQIERETIQKTLKYLKENNILKEYPMAALKQPKFKKGEEVYTYQNPQKPGIIFQSAFAPYDSSNGPSEYDTYKYRFHFQDERGESITSKWTNEESISTIPIKLEDRYKKLQEGPILKAINSFGNEISNAPMLDSKVKLLANNWEKNKANGVTWKRWVKAIDDKIGFTPEQQNEIKQYLLHSQVDKLDENKIMKEWIDFSKATPEQLTKEKEHYKNVKDLDVPRPMLKPKPDTKGMSTTDGVKTWDLYIQDEASNIMIDKYGFMKGYKMWQSSIDYGGAMYQIASNIANEKLKMYRDLGLGVNRADYFSRSYFDVWKQWSGKDGSIKQKVEPNVQKPNVPLLNTNQGIYSEKDQQRIEDIVNKANGNKQKEIQLATAMANAITDPKKMAARAQAAEDNNYHDIAKVFFDKI